MRAVVRLGPQGPFVLLVLAGVLGSICQRKVDSSRERRVHRTIRVLDWSSQVRIESSADELCRPPNQSREKTQKVISATPSFFM